MGGNYYEEKKCYTDILYSSQKYFLKSNFALDQYYVSAVKSQTWILFYVESIFYSSENLFNGLLAQW